MSGTKVVLYGLAYFIPIIFFVCMAVDVLLRNPKRTEHRLVSLVAICFLLMFATEYARHQMPIEYSARISTYVYANAGICIAGVALHFAAKVSELDKRMPRWLYPWIFHVPTLGIIANLLTSGHAIASSRFFEAGVWFPPEYNTAYYVSYSLSNAVIILYLFMLYRGWKKAQSKERRQIFKLLLIGGSVTSAWLILLGYFNFGEWLPPNSQNYAGIIWCFTLRLAMIRFDFMNHEYKRYERMFDMNPAAIVLIDMDGRIREANPSARQLLGGIDTDRFSLFTLLDDGLKTSVQAGREIKDFEATIACGSELLEVLIDGDYMTVDNELRTVLIIRDVTLQKRNQRQIEYMAYNDALTKLPNRRCFYYRLDTVIREAQLNGSRLALVMIDLDHFKSINDKYGHEAGDVVLQYAAAAIEESARGIGKAGRLGGDEFVMFIRNVASDDYVQETVAQLRNRLSGTVIRYGEHALTVEASIGVSYFPDQGTDVDTLMMQADKAMYAEKRLSHQSA
ncbi:histidine kinase N-terminal 7TM domain-containing diguanylate cyclase [Cohnella panacarvi]|uniref:histidine kinase N-terminal 7TM domain-containing diguanylate cyclase n=1 Tax=Cohnella panacarvi TaxID=400776 RepID=UPI00047C2E3C|nr:diguanylate cyclase [Cohnella panacarvi]